ncbi:MAG: iron chelate uptake ABC transporter family permease subunit, partial [Bacillota bacterium]|nr:iron chelate uptake ABC transporter family permease subunit [Bacillota bacterium]
MDFTIFFRIFGDYTFRLVAVGTAVLGIVCGVLGCFAVSRRQSLIGDAVSHSVLPGVVIAFMLTGTKNIFLLLVGATIAGIISILVVSFFKRNTRADFESILATVLSSFFGLGILLLTMVNKQTGGNKAGLDSFISGQVSSLLIGDVVMMIAVSVALLMLVLLFWKEFKVVSFDKEFADVIGFPSGRLLLFLSMLIVTSIIIGLQTVGVIL